MRTLERSFYIFFSMIILMMSLPVFAEEDSINQQELIKLTTQTDTKASLTFSDWGSKNPFDVSTVPGIMDVITPGKQSTGAGLMLQGIFLGSDNPSAIINDTVVTLGDSIKGLKLKEIKEGAVILVSEDGKQMPLSLNKQ